VFVVHYSYEIMFDSICISYLICVSLASYSDHLILSENKLTGQLPDELYNLRALSKFWHTGQMVHVFIFCFNSHVFNSFLVVRDTGSHF
jgi:hypothetical protein